MPLQFSDGCDNSVPLMELALDSIVTFDSIGEIERQFDQGGLECWFRVVHWLEHLHPSRFLQHLYHSIPIVDPHFRYVRY